MSGKNIIDMRRGRGTDMDDGIQAAEPHRGASMPGDFDLLDLADLDAAELELEGAELDIAGEEMDASEPMDEPLARRLLFKLPLLLAVVWTGFYGWLTMSRAQGISADGVPAMLRDYVVPVVGIGLFHLLLVRNSRVQSRRYTDTAALLRHEGLLLEHRMKRLAGDLAAARNEVAAQALAIEQMSSGSSQRLKAVAETLSNSAESFNRSAGQAQRSGDALANRLNALDDAMPGLEDRALRMGEGLQETAEALNERLGALETRVTAIVNQTSEVRSQIVAASKSLTAQLTQLTEATRGAQQGLEGMADIAVSRMDLAGERAEQLIGASRTALEAQAEALEALVETSTNEIGTLGKEAVTEFEGHATQVRQWLTELTEMTERHAHASGELESALSAQAEAAGVRLAALVEQGMAGNDRLLAATETLRANVDVLTDSLSDGNGEAEALIGRADRLLVTLDSGVRELGAAVPQALDRLDERIRASQGLISQATPEMEKLEAVADGMLGRVQEAADHMLRHQSSLDALAGGTETGLGRTNSRLRDMRSELESLDKTARDIADSATPQLVEALGHIRETAEKAADKAREALAHAIADAANCLGETSGQVLQETMAGKVAEQLDALATAAQAAAASAETCVTTLEQRIAALTQASADMEKRADQAQQSLEVAERDSLARRSALLIEALNSTAIDVSKLLSGEVTDMAWNAYLKGDRGAFTRKAVRLLDNGETRRIASLYQQDAAFSEHVNRYIHDFEAMLRDILANREGSALGVTLLSSDMGKLYVALAQGIERLRN